MYFLMQCPYLLMQKIELLASMSTNRMFKISWLLRSLTVISLYYCRLTLSKLSKKTFYDPNWQFGKYKVDSWVYRYLKIKETKRRYCIVEYMCQKLYRITSCWESSKKYNEFWYRIIYFLHLKTYYCNDINLILILS